MSTKWSFKYVSAACSELSKAEIEMLIEQLYSDSRYESATESSIQELAEQMFPDVYRWRAAKQYEAIQEAVELLQRADQILADVPDASDEVSRSRLEIRNNVVYLQRENGGES